MGRKHHRSGRSGLFPGLVLLTLGTLFLLDRTEVMDIGSLWRWWPAVLILFGIQHLAEPEKDTGWGVGLISLGTVYFFLNFHVMGLTWQTGWPLILVAVGLGFIAGAFTRREPEVSREAD